MPRLLFGFWVVGIVLLSPIVFTADRFFVREYGPLAGYVSGFALWVFVAALTYLVLRLFARTFLQERDFSNGAGDVKSPGCGKLPVQQVSRLMARLLC